MKQTTKHLIALTLVCTMICSILSAPAQAGAKKGYWLSGISQACGGNMRMYYKNEHTIILKGKYKKSAKQKALHLAPEKKRSLALSVADGCKVTLAEAGNNQTVSYAAWARGVRYKKGDEISFLQAELKIKNNKIVRISFSA